MLNMCSSLEPLKRHSDMRSSRLDNTGNWILQLDQVKTWRDVKIDVDGSAAVLSCYGMPGAGKTVLRCVIAIADSNAG